MLGDISCPGGHTAPRHSSREAGSGASGRFASSYIKRLFSYRLLWPEGARSCVLLCAKVCRAKNGGRAKDEPGPECRSQQNAAARHHGQGDQFGDGKDGNCDNPGSRTTPWRPDCRCQPESGQTAWPEKAGSRTGGSQPHCRAAKGRQREAWCRRGGGKPPRGAASRGDDESPTYGRPQLKCGGAK